MNARHNFYSSVFEVINSYKKKADSADDGRNFFMTIMGLGVFAAILVVVVFSDVGSRIFESVKFTVASTHFSFLKTTVTSPDHAVADQGFGSPLFRVAPFADTYIDASTPTVVYGQAVLLQISQNPDRRIFYSFNIPPMPAAIQSAILFLPKSDTGNGTYDLYRVLGTVIDEALSHYLLLNRAPVQKIRSGIPLNAAAQIDILSHIESNSSLTIMLRATSGTAQYASREAGTRQIPIIELR